MKGRSFTSSDYPEHSGHLIYLTRTRAAGMAKKKGKKEKKKEARTD